MLIRDALKNVQDCRHPRRPKGTRLVSRACRTCGSLAFRVEGGSALALRLYLLSLPPMPSVKSTVFLCHNRTVLAILSDPRMSAGSQVSDTSVRISVRGVQDHA